MSVQINVNGQQVEVETESASLLDVLREQVGVHSVKDGCSPQGQCGCCTVLVDGAPRVACVTPVRRVAGRAITTIEGLAEVDRSAWAEAFCASGASQCGFCTPGIVIRLEGARTKGVVADDRSSIGKALAAHLCRCTGWQTIEEAYAARVNGESVAVPRDPSTSQGSRDFGAAAQRAEIEGGVPQRVDPDVALGRGGFADDTAPAGALVAVPDGNDGWAVGATLAEARMAAGKIQGRRTTVDAQPPVDLPDGDWVLSMRTSWVDPAYLETDASWCEPGGEPSSPLGNGGAFGGKRHSSATVAARSLADQHRQPVRVVFSREDCVRLGPKRPPMAIGVRADGRGVVRVARTEGIVEAMGSFAEGFTIEEVDVAGPPTSVDLRGAGWAELAVVAAVRGHRDGEPFSVVAPSGGRAAVQIGADGMIAVSVDAGSPLDDVVLRSYAIGAVHQALSWVTSEALAVDEAGVVQDLTVRSFGILRAIDMPMVEVEIERSERVPVNGSDAVFAATAAAVWSAQGLGPVWPTRTSWPPAR